mmetsp:Transcript_5496/g.9327  ORF Transcript_5496/g.9327 Transcript_5496/m.9327 type:complete len:117 (+) Transcript_5496:16-366(+)
MEVSPGVTTSWVLSKLSQIIIAFYLIQLIRVFNFYIQEKVNANETDKLIKLKQKVIMVIFGSGGHTTEMLLMLKGDNIFEKYEHVHFVVGHSDTWSLKKITDFYDSCEGIDLMEQA